MAGLGLGLGSRAPLFSVGGGCRVNKMRRFLRTGHDPARERLKRDLFQFNKVRGEGGRPCSRFLPRGPTPDTA